MENIIEALINIIPFSHFLQILGLNEEKSIAIATIVNASILWLFIKFFKQIDTRIKYYRSGKNLKSQFDYLSIKKAVDCFIPTCFQFKNLPREEDFLYKNMNSKRNKLIPHLIKNVFNEKINSERFFIVMADSGMGKTTFLINLYLRYISFWNFYRKRNSKIVLFKLGNINALEEIKSISSTEAKDTILLLDALDEDPFIIQSNNCDECETFTKRLNEIIEIVKVFSIVIFTCRTQFFPNQEDEPFELNIKRLNERGFYILNKLYILPFSRKNIRKFINKKFPWWQFWKIKRKRRAKILTSESIKIFVRPMLINYIDDLVQEKKEYYTQYSIYETLIEVWLKRDAEKYKHSKEKEEFITNLLTLSENLAYEIYTQSKNNKGYIISSEQTYTIAKKCNITLDPAEITGKSLLTYEGLGNWKFAHKSIFEYFLFQFALKHFKNDLEQFCDGQEMYSKFLYEKIVLDFLNKRYDTNTKYYLASELNKQIQYKSIRDCNYQEIWLMLFIADEEYCSLESTQYLFLMDELTEFYFIHHKYTYQIYILIYIFHVSTNNYVAKLNLEKFNSVFEIRHIDFFREKLNWLTDYVKNVTFQFTYRYINPKHFYYSILSHHLDDLKLKEEILSFSKNNPTEEGLDKLNRYINELSLNEVNEITQYIDFCLNICSRLSKFQELRLALF